MRRVLPILVLLLLAACREPEPEAEPGGLPPLPDFLRDARAACERAGGQMIRAGVAGAMTCIRETRDSGRSCQRATDCESECLARSRTCAPFSPMLGCHDVLMSTGAQATQCRD